MDEALQAAWRAAQAAPDDAATRAAYGQALLRSGRRLAAALELADARRLEGDARVWPLGSREVPLERPSLPGGPALEWGVGPRPVGLPAPTPPLPDAQLGHVLLVRSPEFATQACLVPRPSCSACERGQVECPRCDGRGQIIEFTGRAEERLPCDACRETGRASCPTCEGALLVPRRGRPSACDHVLGPVIQGGAVLQAMEPESASHPAGWLWALHRCQQCGLCLLRDPAGDDHPACAGCGTFACDGTCVEVGDR